MYLSKYDHFKIFTVFIVISIAFTWPLILNMNNVSGMDDYIFVHSFWWFKKSLFSFNPSFFSDYILYPQGASLAFHATTFSNFLLTLPVSLIFGVNIAVNTAYLFTLILSAYTAFLLAFELTGSKPAALIAAVIFAFNPFHVSIQGRAHLHISTLQWIPLYFLMFKRAIERDEKKWAIFAGIGMGLIILTDQMQTISVGIITALAVPLLFFRKDFDLKRVIPVLAIMAGVAFLTSGIYLYEAIREIISHPEATKVGPMEHGGANMFSGDLLVYFIPPAHHPLWGKWFADYAPHRENAAFFGYIPLFLAITGAVRFFKKGTVKFIVGVTFLFWVLSLGTYLHINNEWEWGGNIFALPFLYLTDLPLIGDIRTPCRFHMITILGISILASYGLKGLLEMGKIATQYVRLTFVISALIVLEFLPVPQLVTATPTPALYKEMAKDKEDYTVLELPMARWSGIQRNGSGNPAILMYYQTVHGKRIFNGHISRLPIEVLDFKDPLLDLFSRLSSQDNFRAGRKLGDPTEAEFLQVRKTASDLSKGSEEFFKRYDIRYIVLHEPISWNNTLSRAFVEGFTGKSLVDVPDDNIAYIKVQ